MASSPLPSYFRGDGDRFLPTELARSPWDKTMQSGVAIGGLLAHILRREIDEETMTVARLGIDILGSVPRRETSSAIRVLREGKRVRLIEAEIIVDGRAAARATALVVRKRDTPAIGTPPDAPPPDAELIDEPISNPMLRGAITRRIVRGGHRIAGPGAMWTRFDLEVVAGTPTAPLERAAMLGDLGSGIGGALSPAEWTYANLDISIHFTRLPQGEWMLVDARSDSAGNGVAIVTSIFADIDGVFGHGHQTLFVDPRR